MHITNSKKHLDNLIFRPLQQDDLAFLLEIRNECKNYLHDDRDFTLEQANKWFYQSKPKYYIIELVKSKEPIGYFRTSHWDEKNKHLYIGCDLHKNYRGLGLAKKSYVEFMDYLFSKFGFNKIALEVLAHNERAFSLYKKIGFVIEGVKRQDVYRDGNYIDSICMSILFEEWQHIRKSFSEVK